MKKKNVDLTITPRQLLYLLQSDCFDPQLVKNYEINSFNGGDSGKYADLGLFLEGRFEELREIHKIFWTTLAFLLTNLTILTTTLLLTSNTSFTWAHKWTTGVTGIFGLASVFAMLIALHRKKGVDSELIDIATDFSTLMKISEMDLKHFLNASYDELRDHLTRKMHHLGDHLDDTEVGLGFTNDQSNILRERLVYYCEVLTKFCFKTNPRMHYHVRQIGLVRSTQEVLSGRESGQMQPGAKPGSGSGGGLTVEI
ncbi:MAG: hypothetical protein AAB381_03190 [Patescibacteria group bacterium]